MKTATRVGTRGARRLTQGQSIAEAAQLAKLEERDRCLEVCFRMLKSSTNGGARNAVREVAENISKGE